MLVLVAVAVAVTAVVARGCGCTVVVNVMSVIVVKGRRVAAGRAAQPKLCGSGQNGLHFRISSRP